MKIATNQIVITNGRPRISGLSGNIQSSWLPSGTTFLVGGVMVLVCIAAPSIAPYILQMNPSPYLLSMLGSLGRIAKIAMSTLRPALTPAPISLPSALLGSLPLSLAEQNACLLRGAVGVGAIAARPIPREPEKARETLK